MPDVNPQKLPKISEEELNNTVSNQNTANEDPSDKLTKIIDHIIKYGNKNNTLTKPMEPEVKLINSDQITHAIKVDSEKYGEPITTDTEKLRKQIEQEIQKIFNHYLKLNDNINDRKKNQNQLQYSQLATIPVLKNNIVGKLVEKYDIDRNHTLSLGFWVKKRVEEIINESLPKDTSNSFAEVRIPPEMALKNRGLKQNSTLTVPLHPNGPG